VRFTFHGWVTPNERKKRVLIKSETKLQQVKHLKTLISGEDFEIFLLISSGFTLLNALSVIQLDLGTVRAV
jgi:hypothetical protein